MRRTFLGIGLAALALLLARDAWTQGLPTATLSGRVTDDEKGGGLPGVSVTVSSPHLQGIRSTVTSAIGDYLFVSLPPGHYKAVFSLGGFQTAAREVDLAGSQSFTVSVALGVAPVESQATVVGRADIISETTLSATTMSAETMSSLPTDRSIWSAVGLVPGLSQYGQNGSITIAGAMTYENLFLMDGAKAETVNLYIEDALQETTAMTGAISAEYGRFGGGVINAVTKSGGNTFSGSFRTSFSNAAWKAVPPMGSPGVQQVNETYEATFGGPILKDKIWFFEAGGYSMLDSVYTTQTTLIPVNQTFEDLRYEGKLTFSPFQNHTLTGSYLGRRYNYGNDFFSSFGTYDLASFYDDGFRSHFAVGNYNGVLTSNFFVEALYSEKHYTSSNTGSRTTDLIQGTPIWDVANNAMWSSPVFCAVCPEADYERNNTDFFAKGTYFLSTPKAGSHNFVAGYEQFHGHTRSNNYQSGSQYIASSDDTRFSGQTPYPVFSSGVAYLGYYPILQPAVPSDFETRSAFLNDTWKLSNTFTFNLGIRYDRNNSTDMSGVERQKDSAWSPRLGVTFDPKGDGRLRFNVSYARYVSAVQENFAGAASGAGNPAYFYYLYGGDDINTGPAPWLSAADALRKFFSYWGITRPNMFPVLNQDTLFFAGYPGVNQKIADGMTAPHTDEVAIGVSGSPGPRFTYRVGATYRKGGGFVENVTNMSTGQVTDPVGNVYDVHVIQNGGDEYRRTYYGLAAQFTWRPIGRLNLGGNWTWAHSYGNFDGQAVGFGPLTGGFNSYPEYRQLSWFAPSGELMLDQRHRVRLFGTYDVPLPKAAGHLGVSGTFQANSGLSYSAIGKVEVASYVQDPGYATPPVNNSYYFSSRGAYVTPAWYQADLALNYSYDVGPVQLFVQPQVLNVFNTQHQDGTNLNTTVYTSVNKGYLAKFNPFTKDHDTLVECPATATAAQCRAMGANWQVGPTFGQGSNMYAYQQPRTFRVSVGLRF